MEPSSTVLAKRLIDRARTSVKPRVRHARTAGVIDRQMAGRRWGVRAILAGTQTAVCCGAMRAAGIRSDSKRVSSVAPNPPAPITT